MATEKNGFLRNLFLRNVREELVFPFPRMKQEEQEMLTEISRTIKNFGKEFDAGEMENHPSPPEKILNKIRDLGLFGLIIPEQYEGMGLSVSGYARALEDLSALGTAVGVTIGAHQSIGMKALLLCGNEAQKSQYLPQLASGELIAAFCLTEPDSGSDAASIKTRAVLSEDGTHYILNGSKQFITNGGIADFYTVFAQTPGVGEQTHDSITAFMVTRDMGGVRSGPEEQKMGWKGSSTTPVYFENTKVPAENVLGEVGKGFKVAMEVLNNGRLSTSTGALGVAHELIDRCIKYAKERKQFGRPIGEFDLIKEKIADMAMMAYAMDSLGYMTAGLVDNGEGDYAIEAGVAKVFSTEALWKMCDDAMQVHGGMGYVRELPIERFLRDARLGLIVEGTSEISRAMIALEGIKTLAKFMKKTGLKGYAQKSFSSAKVTKAHPLLQAEAQLFAKGVDRLNSYAMQFVMVFKKDVISKQFHQKRIAEAVIDLYAMIATISRTTALLETGKTKEQCLTEIYLTRSFCRLASERIATRMDQFDLNHDFYLSRLADALYEDGAYKPEIFDLGSAEALAKKQAVEPKRELQTV